MKRFLGLLLLVIGLISVQSCSEDECKDVNCNNGVCVDGTCDCEAGYGGSDCTILLRDAYLGSWKGTDCEEEESNLTVTAGDTNDIIKLQVDGVSVDGKIISANSVKVEKQSIPTFLGDIEVVGNGTLNSNGTFSLTMTVTSAFASGTCTVDYTKQ